MAEKLVAFPPARDNCPSEANTALESDYDTLCAVQYDDGKQQALDNPGLFNMMGQAMGQVATFLDPKESAVGEALKARNYSVVRTKFKDHLPAGAVGKGSFGMVYKATKQGAKGSIACGIKMIENSHAVAHLIDKEIDTLGMFRHPAMINFVETFYVKEKDWRFIVQEFAPGGDLLQAVTNQPEAFDEALVRVMTYHICCAVGFAHQRGIMHRDLKPENILLTEYGFPKVCDFGLSRRLNETDLAHTKAGTPVYMAPEIMRGRPYEFSVDVYAVGLILRDMMAKVTVVEWMINMIPPQSRPPPKRWPNGQCMHTFSPALVNLMQKMSAERPSTRPTFFRVIKDLGNLAKSNPKPHPFWGPPMVTEIIKPKTGPPRGRKLSALFTPTMGDDMAQRSGFHVGMDVQILVHNAWLQGKVEHISKAIIPGAVHVRYTENGESKVRVVDPNYFGKHLKGKGTRGSGKCCAVQ